MLVTDKNLWLMVAVRGAVVLECAFLSRSRLRDFFFNVAIFQSFRIEKLPIIVIVLVVVYIMSFVTCGH